MKLETERLILQPPAERDVEAIVAVASDRRIAEMTLMPHPFLPADALEWVEMARERWEKHGFGGFAVFRRHDGAFVGAAGLRPLENPRHASAGYWFSPAVWGAGFATEALVELLRFGFTDRGLERIESRHVLSNPASGRVMEKAGLGHPVPQELPDREGEGMVPGIVRHLDADEWHSLPPLRIPS